MNKKIKTLWGISEVGFFMMSSMETMFFMFFLTNVAMIPLFITGIITSFSAIVDAFSAVLAGFVIDKVKFRNGKYRPWLIICPPLVTVFFTLMFTKIGGNVTAGIICSICYILSHFVWNICWTANRDLITVISKDPQDRAWLSSRIGVGSNIGKIGNSLVVPTVSAALLGVLSGVGAYTVIALIFALCFSVCYVVHYVITKGYDTTENVVGKPISLGEMFRSIFTNSQLLAFFLHDTIRQIAFIGIGSMTSYYCLVVLGDQALSSTMLIAFYVGGVLGGVIAPQFTKRIGSKKTKPVSGLRSIPARSGFLRYVLRPDGFLLCYERNLWRIQDRQICPWLGYGCLLPVYQVCSCTPWCDDSHLPGLHRLRSHCSGHSCPAERHEVPVRHLPACLYHSLPDSSVLLQDR